VTNIDGEIWFWHHNRSECYYHIQITVKYRKSLLDEQVKQVITESMKGFKERYDLEIQTLGYDQNHLHILCRFLPKYSGGDVVRLIKSITAKQVFKQVPEIKKELWGGEFWSDGYYIATVSGRGDRVVIEKYIRNQGRNKEIEQLKLIDLDV
jgi:putative transposase